MKRRRRISVKIEHGRSWSIAEGDPPPKKLKAFRAGQIVPQGAQYITFAIKKDVPHFFFLLPEKPKSKRRIGFDLA